MVVQEDERSNVSALSVRAQHLCHRTHLTRFGIKNDDKVCARRLPVRGFGYKLATASFDQHDAAVGHCVQQWAAPITGVCHLNRHAVGWYERLLPKRWCVRSIE